MRPFHAERVDGTSAVPRWARTLRVVAYAGAVALLLFILSAWVGLWPGESPVWSRPRLSSTPPADGAVPLWTLDAPRVPPDFIIYWGPFPLAQWSFVLVFLLLACGVTYVSERGRPRRYEPLAYGGALLVLIGGVFAARAADFMSMFAKYGDQVPRSLQHALSTLLIGAALAAIGLARIALAPRRRDGATLALTALIVGLAMGFICERFLVRPDQAHLAPVAAGFEFASVPEVPPSRRWIGPGLGEEIVDEVLEVAVDGAVTHVGRFPGAGPRVPWPSSEVRPRLHALAAEMPTAPMSAESSEMVPDGVLYLRIDGRAPARVLTELQEAARAAGIWRLALLFVIEGLVPETALLLYLPKDSIAAAGNSDELRLSRGAHGTTSVEWQGQALDWSGARSQFPAEFHWSVAEDVPIAAMIDVMRRSGFELEGPIRITAPR